MTPAQCRAARGLVDWKAWQLARKAGVDPSTLSQFERGHVLKAHQLTVDRLRMALEGAGVQFLDDKGVTL